MNENIKELIEKINHLNSQLSARYKELSKKYGFHLAGKKIVFLKEFRERNLKFKIPTWKYAIPRDIRHLLSLPFIYMMIIPILILDVFISIYHAVAFSLYHIPKVKRRDFIVYDRKFLDYLNFIQKINCLYCSYVNGFLAYAVEIGSRTERYWCPIKAANKPKFSHGWYSEFADFGNPEEWKEKFNDENAFLGVCKSTSSEVDHSNNEK